MKKYRLTALVLVAGICAASFSGCKPTDDAPVSAAAVSSPTAASASHIKQTFPNGLTIDADVSIPKGINTKAVKIQKVEAVPFSSEKVSRTLLQGHEIKAHKSRSQGATRGGNKAPVDIYSIEDNCFLNIDPAMGQISFSTPLAKSISYAYFDGIETVSSTGKSNRKKFNKKSLSFMTPGQAVQKAKELLTQWGVPALSQVDVVALDHATLQSEEEDPKKVAIKPKTAPNKKGTWTENDECYVLHCQQDIDGIPVSKARISNDTQPSSIIMYLGKNGVVKLEATAYRPTGDKPETKQAVPVEKAVKAFTDMYSAAKLPSAATVSAIRLHYGLQLTQANSDVYQFSPVWGFELSMLSDNQKDKMTSTIYVDAVTGKLIRN